MVAGSSRSQHEQNLPRRGSLTTRGCCRQRPPARQAQGSRAARQAAACSRHTRHTRHTRPAAPRRPAPRRAVANASAVDPPPAASCCSDWLETLSISRGACVSRSPAFLLVVAAAAAARAVPARRGEAGGRGGGTGGGCRFRNPSLLLADSRAARPGSARAAPRGGRSEWRPPWGRAGWRRR
jgi:hypothetical protein